MNSKQKHYGATPAEWAHFGKKLGLARSLRPVASNITAPVAENSSLEKEKLGKVPSLYNSEGAVYGLSQWVDYTVTKEEVKRWLANPDLGICVATGDPVYAVDVDVTDKELADKIHQSVRAALPGVKLVRRVRSNSSKFLLPFVVTGGQFGKAHVKTGHGGVDFLGKGQQFVAIGTHPSGVRYEWEGGLPESIPTITSEQYSNLVEVIGREFGNGETANRGQTDEQRGEDRFAEKQDDALENARTLLKSKSIPHEGTRNDELYKRLADARKRCALDDASTEVLATELAVQWGLTSGEAVATARSVCRKKAAGSQASFAEDFDILPEPPARQNKPKKSRRKGMSAHAMAKSFDPDEPYLMKGLLHRQSYAMLVAEEKSAKTFIALDWSYHVAAGKSWFGHRVEKGPVLYLAFEGSGGLKKRIKAIERQYGSLEGVPLFFEPARWNFLEREDVENFNARLGEIIRDEFNGVPPAMVVIDTLARATVGGDENAVKDMGVLNDVVEGLIDRTGACVLALHHLNKSGGTRGSSSIPAAVDTEIRVEKEPDSLSGRIVPRLQRDIEVENPLGFRLFPVSVGTDRDGDAVRSCVVLPAELPREDSVPKSTAEETFDGYKVCLQHALAKKLQENPGAEYTVRTFKKMKDLHGVPEKKAEAALDDLLANGHLGKEAYTRFGKSHYRLVLPAGATLLSPFKAGEMAPQPEPAVTADSPAGDVRVSNPPGTFEELFLKEAAADSSPPGEAPKPPKDVTADAPDSAAESPPQPPKKPPRPGKRERRALREAEGKL